MASDVRSPRSSSRCDSRSGSGSATTPGRAASRGVLGIGGRLGADGGDLRRALGAHHVHRVSMSSRYSSEGTRDDAREGGRELGVDFRRSRSRGSGDLHRRARTVIRRTRARPDGGEPPGSRPRHAPDGALKRVRVARRRQREQVGARSRLRDPAYGDMVGGFALLKDVYKTDVFRLSRHLNERAGQELIPVTTIERPPTAELRAEQRDDQSLPASTSSTPCWRRPWNSTAHARSYWPSSTPRRWSACSRSSTAPSKAATAPPGEARPARDSAATGGSRSPNAGSVDTVLSK